MVCNKCNNSIPEQRVKLGYKQCTQCSDAEKYGFINIINHKTGNTIQVLPREHAAEINKKGDRKRFGTVLKGGSKNTNYNPRNIQYGCSVTSIGNEALFEEVGKRVMCTFENDGYEFACTQIEKEVDNFNINKFQAAKLKNIIIHLNKLKS